MPLKYYADITNFKLFLLDCGLFGTMTTPPEAILIAENEMKEPKGAFTEDYVMSQPAASIDTSVFYYSNNAKLEIDFVCQDKLDIVPIQHSIEYEQDMQHLY